MNRIAPWAAVIAMIVAGGAAAGQIGLPSGYLFAALVVGLGWALLAPGRVELSDTWFRVGQAVTGVALGTYLTSSTVAGVGSHWAPVLLVSVATLALTIAAGIGLARISGLDRPTASLGMIAGGASGIVGMAGELGGDDRLVAFMQYLRVMIVSLLTPVLVPLLFGVHGHPAATATGAGGVLGTAGGWALTAVCATAGVALGTRLRVPAPWLLGPLILTAVLSVAGLTGEAQVPALARETAFAAIGLRIGLGFDREILVRMARVTPAVLAAIATLLVVCFAFGWVLEHTAHVSLLDGYLATTPGGLYAILPIAFGSGANTTFVLAVQGLRLIAMMVAAPLIVRRMLGARTPAAPR